MRLLVLHTAEGATTIESLGNWFANPANQVSSHAGADDTPDTVGEYVRRGYKAWTASNANPVAIQIELCAFASWDAAEWDRHPVMLANTAKWIAEEAQAAGIPIVKLSPGQAQGGGHGVCQHADLGSWGGGHWDCGPAFPIDRVLDMAKGGAPQPEPKPEETEMAAPATCTDSRNRPWVFYRGADKACWARCGADPPFSLGGEVSDAIAAIPGPDGIIDVYAYTSSGALYSIHADGTGWSDWYGL